MGEQIIGDDPELERENAEVGAGISAAIEHRVTLNTNTLLNQAQQLLYEAKREA